MTARSLARPLCGRIEQLEVLHADAGGRTWTFVVVQTDRGLHGTGEATLDWHEGAVAGAVADLRPLLIGQDAARIEHLWQLMVRGSFWRSTGVVWMSAVSAIDQALWDIRGKSVDLPVYELLGGRCRDRLAVYGTGPDGDTAETFAASAVQVLGEGHRSMKLCPVPATMPVDGSDGPQFAAAVFAAVREAVGPTVRLAVDLHGRTSAAMAVRYAEALMPFDVWFLEEPVSPDDVDGLARVAAATTIPLASGERWTTTAQFLRPLQQGSLAIVQPDPGHCGGISGSRRIALLAEAHHVGYAPHNPTSPVNTAAAAHVAMASPNFVTLEIGAGEADRPEWRDRMVAEPLDIRDGWLYLSDRPGLGIELDRSELTRHPPVAHPRPGLTHADGSVADW